MTSKSASEAYSSSGRHMSSIFDVGGALQPPHAGVVFGGELGYQRVPRLLVSS